MDLALAVRLHHSFKILDKFVAGWRRVRLHVICQIGQHVFTVLLLDSQGLGRNFSFACLILPHF